MKSVVAVEFTGPIIAVCITMMSFTSRMGALTSGFKSTVSEAAGGWSRYLHFQAAWASLPTRVHGLSRRKYVICGFTN
jgi:hypothetical protein